MLNNHTSMREQNIKNILSEIINCPEISRAEISKNTKLNKATVSEIVRQLIEEHYVIETGIGNSSSVGGRKPILLKINKKAGISLSFDIRFDRLSYMTSYLDGQVISVISESRVINKNNVIEIILDIVNQVKNEVIQTPYGIFGISIAIHGIISNNDIIFTPHYDIDKIDLARELEDKLKIPIFIENEANLVALAEASLDNTHKDLVACSMHTGVGAGIIIDEKLYKGFEGRSGEIGHTTLYPNGLECPCGNTGCVEQYCSEIAVLSFYREAKSDNELVLTDLVTDYQNNDEIAISIIEEFSKNLSISMINLMGMYGPEIIYINSSLVNQIPSIIDDVRSHLQSTIYNRVPIELSKIYDYASLFGATVMNIQFFLGIEAIKVPDHHSTKLYNMDVITQ